MRRFRTPRLVVIAIGLFIALGQPASARADGDVLAHASSKAPEPTDAASDNRLASSISRACGAVFQAGLEAEHWKTMFTRLDANLANDQAPTPTKIPLIQTTKVGSALMKVTATASIIQIGIGAKF